MSEKDFTTVEFHEIANIFPLIKGDEFESLVKDIKENGLIDEIVIYEKLILDGRNRYRACIESSINPRFTDYTGSDPLGFVMSTNLQRRHLTSSQRAAVAVESLPYYEKQAKERQKRKPISDDSVREKIPQQKKGKSTEKAASDLQVNNRYVSDAKKIKAESPRTFEKIKSGETTIQEVKKEAKEKKLKENRKVKIETIKEGNTDLPKDKKFNVIYADPPWRYDFSKSDSREIENQYPTMDLLELKNLIIPAANDSILFMWATSPKLAESLELIKAWGFEYKTCAVWDKQKIGMGYYFRQQHELLLVAAKGSLPVPEPSNRKSSVFSYPRGKHSEKPHEFYDLISEMYPEYASEKHRIELFCRTPQDNWSVWGNQSGGT